MNKGVDETMKKGFYLFALSGIMLLIGLVEAFSGFILWLALPSGAGRGGLSTVFLGLSRHSWLDIHDYAAVALVVIVAIHMLLHWKWIVNMTKRTIAYFKESLQSPSPRVKVPVTNSYRS